MTDTGTVTVIDLNADLAEHDVWTDGDAAPLDHVTSAYTTPGFTDEVIHIYKATQLQKGKQDLGHDEVLEIAEFPLEKTITMIKEGVIKDAKTIVGLQCVYLQILGENIGEEEDK